MSDQEPLAVAIKAAITAELPEGVSAYDADEVPGTTGGPSGSTPARFVQIDVERRWVPERRFGGAVPIHGGALTTHYRAPNKTAARALRAATFAALEDRAYALPGGDTVGPFTFESDGGIGMVDGAWSGFDIFTF